MVDFPVLEDQMVTLNPHPDRALIWEPSVFELLQKQVRQIQDEHDRPVIIAICGGSATGKSTQVAQSLKKAFGPEALKPYSSTKTIFKTFPSRSTISTRDTARTHLKITV
ncbi:MAG: hypothetical protein AAF212_04865 [Verrucomicrobiota bacterium]